MKFILTLLLIIKISSSFRLSLSSSSRLSSPLLRLSSISSITRLSSSLTRLLLSTSELSSSIETLDSDDNDGDDNDNNYDDDEIPIYVGPMSTCDEMEAGVSITDLQLKVLVGPSTVCPGRGLFIALEDDSIEEITIPRGTAICGYAKGLFTKSATGDKTVAYIFEDINVAVFFEKKLMKLKDAISVVASKKDIVTDAVKDHKLYFDSDSNEVVIIPNIEDANNYFVPTEDIDENNKDWTVNKMGVYANDLAYHPNIEEDEYNKIIREMNILQLVWRMEASDDGVLIPTWPVVIINKDLRIVNTEPMEVGVTYSYRYWAAARLAAATSSTTSTTTSSTTTSFASSTNQ